MHLTDQQFLEVIARAPLVSIDLVIRDSRNRILLGRRVNEPAKGKWFVPGGRICKDESLEDAFERICLAEIKERHSKSEARFVGAFTHIYDKNVFLAENISTHYVVLAFELCLGDGFEFKNTDQHSEFQWFTQEDTDTNINKNADSDVHEYVLAYFRDPSRMQNDQYEVLNARRDSFNNLVWQTPVLSLTAQAFLFIIIFSDGVPKVGRIIAGFLAAITGFASVQLLAKHRFMEEQHAKILHAYEDACKLYAANREFKATNWSHKTKPLRHFARLKNRVQTWTLRWSSYWLWWIVLWAFFCAAASSIVLNWLGLLNR